MSLIVQEKGSFQHILRYIVYALTYIRGVGRRYANLVCKKADVDLNKRAGELTQEELERIVRIMQSPTEFQESKLRDDLERLKKIRSHRGIRHFWGLRVRGQHTKTTGRRRG
ncbi:unnamed protein product [Hanseniaspora opuntiae]